jgi:hypothetical protein
MTEVTERWRSECVAAAIYHAGVKRDGVATVGTWAMCGADTRRMFSGIGRLADSPVGTAILDVPCGGGFAFRGLRPGQAVPDPRAALGELTCVQRPGGTLRGTSCVTGRGPRKDAVTAMLRRAGVFGNAARAGDIEHWLREFGLDVVTLDPSGALEFFEARSPSCEQAQ